MPRFNVRIERTVIHSTWIEVSADDEDAASQKAEETADTSSRPDWELESESFDTTDIEESPEDTDDDTPEDEDEEESDNDD